MWKYSESFAKYMSNLATGKVIRGGYGKGLTPGAVNSPKRHLNEALGFNGTVYFNSTRAVLSRRSPRLRKRASNYWLTSLTPLGSVSRCSITVSSSLRICDAC